MLSKLLSFRTIFSFFLTICFAYGVWEARIYAPLAKIFPFYISIVLLICSIINLFQEIRGAAAAGDEGQNFADLSTSWNMPIKEVWKKFFLILSMLLSIYVFIWFIGYPLTIILFIFIFYRFVAGASWVGSTAAMLAGLGFLALTSRVLNMEWPEGLIHLPWPLG